MPDRHVKPTDEGWTVTAPEDGDHVTARTATEVEAVERAVDIVADRGGGQVVVHANEGEVVETRHVDAGTTEISRTAAEIAEEAGVEGAVDAVESAIDATGGEDASTAASRVADQTLAAGHGAGGTDTPDATSDPSTAAERTGHTPAAVHEAGTTDEAAGDSGGDAAAGGDAATEDLADEARTAAQDAAGAARVAASEVADTAEDAADEASTTAKKVAGHTRRAGRKAGRTAAAGTSGLESQVEAVREGDTSVRAAAQEAAGIAQTTGAQLADQAEGTVREVAGETRAATRRTAARVESTADDIGRRVAAGADRASILGDEVGDEAEGAADRFGQQIHAVTEAAAAPLDQLAHALNPVRITGRVVGVLVSGGLHLVGVGVTRGSDAAQQRAHQVTGH
jgi:hypothetical protein